MLLTDMKIVGRNWRCDVQEASATKKSSLRRQHRKNCVNRAEMSQASIHCLDCFSIETYPRKAPER
jgi:hypothetical protein